MAFLASPGLCRVVQGPYSSGRGCCPGLLRSPEGTSVRPGCRTALSTPPACQNSSHVDECVGDHPSPTHRSIPSSPRYRLRFSPCHRLSTLIRPSQPVLHFCPLRNQRFFWCFRRAALRVERFGIETRFTPSACASRSFSAE